VHIGGKIMQQVFTLRKIIFIFGFALAAFGCDMNKAQLSNANKEVLSAMYSYSASGELSGYSEIEYDSKGNQTKWNDYNANGELSDYSEAEYDSKGNETKFRHYDANGELQSYMVFFYKSI
jgi:hypothetical protein